VIASGQVEATLSGNYSGTANAPVKVTIRSGDGKPVTDWPGDIPNFTDENYIEGQSSIINIGPYGLEFSLAGVPERGDFWTFNVTVYQAGDKIQIKRSGNIIKEYSFGIDIPANSLNNIVNKILSDNSTVFKNCDIGGGGLCPDKSDRR